ncbi:ferritin-like domain-containing protein [soil metagenome]
MKAKYWLEHFQGNATGRAEPEWHLPSPLTGATRRELARSLSHFQLGESGEGGFLLRQAREQFPDDHTYAQALELFVAEEKEHARLLAHLVERFGGALIRRHWTHSLFRLVRRALGLRFEIQVLVIAELVGTAYYRLLHRRTRDPVLEEVCALVLRDEASHVAFHADWLGEFQKRLLPLERALWASQFQLLFTVAAQVAWVDHRAALSSTGATRAEFFREARAECIAFLEQISAASASRRLGGTTSVSSSF